jgi:hypothetical protein
MLAAGMTDRVPVSTSSAGASMTAETAAGRSSMRGRYQPDGPKSRHAVKHGRVIHR